MMANRLCPLRCWMEKVSQWQMAERVKITVKTSSNMFTLFSKATECPHKLTQVGGEGEACYLQHFSILLQKAEWKKTQEKEGDLFILLSLEAWLFWSALLPFPCFFPRCWNWVSDYMNFKRKQLFSFSGEVQNLFTQICFWESSFHPGSTLKSELYSTDRGRRASCFLFVFLHLQELNLWFFACQCVGVFPCGKRVGMWVHSHVWWEAAVNISFHHPVLSSAWATEDLREGGAQRWAEENDGASTNNNRSLEQTSEYHPFWEICACYFGIWFCSSKVLKALKPPCLQNNTWKSTSC